MHNFLDDRDQVNEDHNPNETFEHVEVLPGIFQTKEDYDANQAFDEARDNELQNNLANGIR